MFELNNVSLFYETPAGGCIEALHAINLSIAPQERLAVIGPSGCGKTSLLLLLAGLLAPTHGSILFYGRPLKEAEEGISLILQDYGLFPWKTVLENVMLGLTFKKIPRQEAKNKALGFLSYLGLSGHAHKYPGQLSGGERQRVAIARALATQPACLLMDEPFSALDALTREQLQDILGSLWRKLRFTMVLVTHSVEEAVFLGSRIIILSPAPGQIANSLQKEQNARNEDNFYQQCTLVRSMLEVAYVR